MGRASVWAAVAAAGVTGGTAAAQDSDDLRLTRVMLSTGGVGYFEYEATVAGDADLTFDVRLDQVDDVLKSVVVYDDQGRVGGVTLPGREPLADIFRELPFDPGALGALDRLLDALRGAEVRVDGPRAVTGRIVSVTPETVALPDGGGTITRHRLTLMTATGLVQLILEEIDSIEFVDPALQAQLDEALSGLADLAQRDRRTLTVTTGVDGAGDGGGAGSGDAAPRTVHVAYVVEVPLWKSTYRLTLPEAGAAGDGTDGGADGDDGDDDAGALQGWAVLENLSGEDWDGVDLSVVSGNPVTFRQALYAAYYVARPEVPVEVLGRVLPGIDVGAIPQQAYETEMAMAPPPPAPSSTRMYDQAADGAYAANQAYDAYAQGLAGGAAASYAPPEDFARLQAAESAEAATQVVFRFPEAISVESGHTLLVPIVDRDIPIERLSLYQPDVEPRHPLASVRLDNDGSTGLPPGVLTLYERVAGAGVTYVGDARLGSLPAGEERLVSYAVDQKVSIDRTDESTQSLARARIVDGVLELTITDRNSTTYVVDGAAEEDRTVVIEHPRWEGWTLVEPEASRVETTPDAYRVRVEVPAGATETVTVAVEQPQVQTYALIGIDPATIAVYVEAKELSPEIRDALAEIGRRQAIVAEAERALKQAQDQAAEIQADQARIRSNLDSVPQDSDLFQRYLERLTKQEDALDDLNLRIEAARAALEQARQDLAGYVRTLSV